MSVAFLKNGGHVLFRTVEARSGVTFTDCQPVAVYGDTLWPQQNANQAKKMGIGVSGFESLSEKDAWDAASDESWGSISDD